MILSDIFTDRRFNRKLFSLALPITVQQLMLALVAAADALMLGKLDQHAMAAVSLATQIQFIQNMFLGAIAAGVGVLGAQYWGKKDRKVLDELFGSGVRISLGISFLFFSGCYFFPEYLMRLFASDTQLIALGAGYLKIAAWSYLITGVSQCYLAIMRVSENAAMSAWISSGAVILNIIFNAVCIFGLFGFPAMGVAGAAVATVIARVIELLWCVGISCKEGFIQLKLKMICYFNRILEMDFWKCSAPILGSYMLWGVGFTSYTAIMGHLGPDAAAANAIAAVVRDLQCCVCNGIAGACSILIGNELGAGNLERGRKYGDRLVIISFLTGFAASLVTAGCIPLVSNFISLTAQAREYMIGMFLILTVYMIGRCVCTIVINGIFYSGGDSLFDVMSLLVCMWGIALPCAFSGAFYFHWPVLVIYACTCLDEVGKIPWVLYRHKQYCWVRNLTR